ncbi:uroplakin-3b [Pogona vitticeps]
MRCSLAISLMMVFGAACGQGPSVYTPRLTSEQIGGKITTSTFVLDQPRCVFNGVVNPTDEIWLVVAQSNAVKNFTNPRSPTELPYQEFEKNHVYMTLSTVPSNYPCPDPTQNSDEITVLRVGDETKCIADFSRPDCNGPLPGPGPYQVKFLAMNSSGPTAETKWSSPIPLIQGKSPETIDTNPEHLSAGTIAIATILSILFALLLAALIAALIYKYSDVCGGADIVTVRDPATVMRYTTHHIYDQPANKF